MYNKHAESIFGFDTLDGIDGEGRFKVEISGRLGNEATGHYDKESLKIRNNMYVTTTERCPNHCAFCRNDNMEFGKKKIFRDFRDNYYKVAPSIHSVTFGGGEPLLRPDILDEVVFDAESRPMKRFVVTSGPRNSFLQNQEILDGLDGIYLSRQKADDNENQKAFGGKTRLVELADLGRFDLDRRKITACVTAHKDGGVASAEEMLDFIRQMQGVGINNVMFNNLQREVSGAAYYDKNNVPDEAFEAVKKVFSAETYKGHSVWEQKTPVVFSGGYTISTLKNDWGSIAFKLYHKSKEETARAWAEANRRTYDFSMSPNGDLFQGFTNEKKVDLERI